MGKIESLCDYIKQCDSCISDSDRNEAEKLANKIIGIYSDEISNITANLDMYFPHFGGVSVDYLGDIEILKAKLVNYKDNLELTETQKIKDLEKLKLQQSIMTINNTATNANENTASSVATSNVKVSFEQVIENINDLPNDILTQDEKDELEDKLAGIESALKKKDKVKLSAKLGGVVKYIADKSFDVGIAVLPYLGEVAKYIPLI